ncbi:flagellar basal body rod protein FlgB [Halalkalibacterium halodurans]|nr:flagellar basal body rod protein FlgB [Halalkalibacterium halodurans]
MTKLNLFSSSTLSALEKGLYGASLQQRAISQNIANVDTPNYKAKKVNFQKVFDEALSNTRLQAKQTHEKHIAFNRSQGSSPVETIRQTAYNHNGNNVDVDLEMTELAKNQIYYNALIERVNGNFNSLQTVIRGGR